MNRTDLADSSFSGNHTAFRSVTAFCRPGILNTGIGFDEDDDVVVVPDQPNFVFSEGFTVAAWVKPVALGGVRTIFRKREEGTSTFVLVENGQNFQIVISLANGKAADVQAKATLDQFTHVAATYDGIFLKLYLDGRRPPRSASSAGSATAWARCSWATTPTSAASTASSTTSSSTRSRRDPPTSRG